jgi:hypothetical protein
MINIGTGLNAMSLCAKVFRVAAVMPGGKLGSGLFALNIPINSGRDHHSQK